MKSAVISLLFVGMVLYLSAPLMRIASAPTVAAAEEYIQQSTAHLQGIIVRDETVIALQDRHAVFTAASGQAVAAGSTVAVSGSKNILAPTAGIYVQDTDGFEHLTSDMLLSITPEEIERLLLATPEPISNQSKIIAGNSWLLAVIAEPETILLLQEGQAVTLNVQADPSFLVTATVVHISPAESHKSVVVFRCIDCLQHTLALRKLTVSLSNKQTEGLRIPSQAIQTDEAGSFVYTLTASKAKKTYVTILSEDPDFTIISKDSSADAVRAGDMIIISAPNLKDGLLIR